MGFDQRLHPRGHGGRFVSAGSATVRSRARGGDQITEQRPIAGTPRTLPPGQFEAATAPRNRLYRGVKSDAGAAAALTGGLGHGDYGPGIYLGRQVATAQNYAQQAGHDRGGRVLRAALDPNARVVAPPRKIERQGGTKIAAWARDNNVDVIDLGNYQVVRNPAVLTFDEHPYTLDESVVLDHLAGGYPIDSLPDEYQPIAARLGLR